MIARIPFQATAQSRHANGQFRCTESFSSATQIAAQAADAAYLDYVIKCQQAIQNGSQQWTSWKDLVRGGGIPPAAGAPLAPTLPAAVAAVAPGVELRFRAAQEFPSAKSPAKVLSLPEQPTEPRLRQAGAEEPTK